MTLKQAKDAVLDMSAMEERAYESAKLLSIHNAIVRAGLAIIPHHDSFIFP